MAHTPRCCFDSDLTGSQSSGKKKSKKVRIYEREEMTIKQVMCTEKLKSRSVSGFTLEPKVVQVWILMNWYMCTCNLYCSKCAFQVIITEVYLTIVFEIQLLLNKKLFQREKQQKSPPKQQTNNPKNIDKKPKTKPTKIAPQNKTNNPKHWSVQVSKTIQTNLLELFH